MTQSALTEAISSEPSMPDYDPHGLPTTEPEANQKLTPEKLALDPTEHYSTAEAEGSVKTAFVDAGRPGVVTITTMTEPAPRASSEIEREAAKLYEQSTANSVESWLEHFDSCDTLFTWHDELNRRMAEYRRVYDYARSIGAIE